VDPSERGTAVSEESGDVRAIRGVTDPRDTTNLCSDVGSQVGVHVDTDGSRAGCGKGVRGLTADALAGTDDDEAPAVEPQQRGEIGDRSVVGAGHERARSSHPTVESLSSVLDVSIFFA
jgi:hypothetical protein